jgi:hypothetical protein
MPTLSLGSRPPARAVVDLLLHDIWEPGFLILVSQDFTSTFHVIAFITGFAVGRAFRRSRADTSPHHSPQDDSRGEQPP